MITIKKSQTADTRTCDFANVSKQTLLASSRQHIGDVVKALAFFSGKLTEAAGEHDYDKLTAIDLFHADFVTGFKQTGWWDNHRNIHRHHLDKPDGVPADVNLLDVLEHIADCVMAGMARSGSVYDLNLPDDLLRKAFKNTVELLKANVQLAEMHTSLKDILDKSPILDFKAELLGQIADALEGVPGNTVLAKIEALKEQKTKNEELSIELAKANTRIVEFMATLEMAKNTITELLRK